MNRWKTFLVTVVVFVILITGGLLFYIRELRREARHRRYLELSANENEEITITVPEGWRREQIAILLEEKGVAPAEDFLEATADDEGTLFPDTYRFFKLTPAKDVKTVMQTTYRQKAPQNVDANTLIIASIVEREAKKPEERAGIAAVYWNRYNANLGLTADPTVQYGKDNNNLRDKQALYESDSEKNTVLLNFDFWGPITRADYQSVDSAYNTYRNAGLPPTPICNPGVASIEAALKPDKSDYYYFLHTANGDIIYAKTIDEHNRNKLKYL